MTYEYIDNFACNKCKVIVNIIITSSVVYKYMGCGKLITDKKRSELQIIDGNPEITESEICKISECNYSFLKISECP